MRLTTKPAEEERKTIVYGRVSSNDQKQDLVRQIEVLSQFCVAILLGIRNNPRLRERAELQEKRIEKAPQTYIDESSRTNSS